MKAFQKLYSAYSTFQQHQNTLDEVIEQQAFRKYLFPSAPLQSQELS